MYRGVAELKDVNTPVALFKAMRTISVDRKPYGLKNAGCTQVIDYTIGKDTADRVVDHARNLWTTAHALCGPLVENVYVRGTSSGHLCLLVKRLNVDHRS